MNRYRCDVLNRSLSKQLLIFLLPAVLVTELLAQEVSENSYMIDRSTERSKQLEVVFQALYGEITHGIVASLNSTDQDLIKYTITDVPYIHRTLEITSGACTDFDSQDWSALDVQKLVSTIAYAEQAEYEDKYDFLESIYQSLSPTAKSKFDELIDTHAVSTAKMQVRSMSIESRYRESGREKTLEHIASMCSKLPAVKALLKEGKAIITESAIEIRSDDHD